MGKFSSVVSLFLLIVGCVLLPSCGGGSPTTAAPEVAPTGVSISPSPSVSLEVGNTQQFTATPVANRFSFQSSNQTVLTVANNGLACAGTWNSLSVPTVCTPGSVGVSQVTATSVGVVSSPVSVYVHAPITSVTISKVPGQLQTLRDDCLSKGTIHGPEHWLYQANAFNGTTDITSSVGPFAWQQITTPGALSVVNLAALPNGTQGCSSSPQGQCLNQQTATANLPGIGQVFASAGGFSSQPISVETCRIQSISVAANGDVPSHTSFVVSSGTAMTLNATATDIAGQSVTGIPLTWSASNPASVAVSGSNSGSVYASIGTVSSPAVGSGTVIASCTPPTCNAGIEQPTSPIQLSLPIYPQAAISFEAQTASTTTTPPSPTVYATTTACANPIRNGVACTPALVPITRASATAGFTAGAPVALTSPPNSLVYDDDGANAYLGVDTSNFGLQGLMVFSGSAVTPVTSAPGKVLAVSPDRSSVIVSDTVDSPNQVFICNSCTATGRTVTSLLITGATAAAFSPDSLKAYILAGNNLHIFSKVDPLQTVALGAGVVANDVAFHPEGGFAYVADSSLSITPYQTCNNLPAAVSPQMVTNNPLLIRTLPDGQTLLVLDPPNIDVVTTSFPNFPQAPVLCSATVNSAATSFNLGQGSFIPTQVLVSPNGLTAYILGETSAGTPPSRLPFVVVFNVNTETSSVISLTNSAVPLSASVSPAGDLLFVGADDGTVHVIDTASGQDTQQVTFPFPTNALCFGPGNPATQVALSQVSISAVAQSGSNGVYTYALISGPALKVGESITVTSMSNGADDGTFTISALGSDASGNLTFTVANSSVVGATGQSGAGTVPITCNPDLVAAKP